MKILLINGSAKKDGCTNRALTEVAETLEQEGITAEIMYIGTEPVRDCIGCGACAALKNRCVFDDDIVNRILKEAETADGFVFATPVYYAHPSGRLLSVMDRLFYSGSAVFAYKPAAAVASARRAGTTASLDAIQKHFLFAKMPIVASTYWNVVHGSSPKDTEMDFEGLQTLRNLAMNMAWLIKCIQAGKDNGIALPQNSKECKTNFIR